MPEITQEELDKLKTAQTERDDLKKKLDAKSKERDDDEDEDDEDEDDDKKKKSKKSKSRKDDDEDDEDEDEDEGDLNSRVKKERKASEDAKNQTKRLESSLKFNMGISEFVKTNADILPSEVPEILKAADKEKYDSAGEKAAAIRTALIKAFFEVQAHVDLLTPSQKTSLEDYLKLTKNGREEKAEFIFENLFEPALAMLKKLKKAEEVGKANSGFAMTGKVEDDYKERLMATSRKTHLGQKEK